MTDIRRTILWVVFTFSLFMLWDAWNKHNGRPSMFAPAPPAATAPAAGAAGNAASAVPQATGTAPAAAAATPVAGGAAAPTGQPVVLTTDVVKATFNTQGAALVRLELLKHPADDNPSQPMVLFDRTSDQRSYVAQTGLITAEAGRELPTHLAPMTLAPGPLSLADGADKLSVRFESAEQGGVKLVKTFTFHRGSYAVDVSHEVVNTGSTPVNPELYLQLVRDGSIPPHSIFMAPTSFTGPAVYTEAGKYQKVEFSDIEKGKAEHATQADNGWVAMVQHYFVSAWLFNDKGERQFRTTRVGPNLYSVTMVLPLGTVQPGATVTRNATLYAGPQEEKKLEKLATNFDLVKDYGILTVLSKPMFWLLDKLHGILGNWGWSIVALVVILKIAFYWLNASAYRSMAKMKAVNPRIMELRERYKDKPQLMQQEMMRIYREEKVNPMGGCLPIFVQMPFFFALYWVLLSTVEMRGAPWIGWIHDLSIKDPYYILPLLMTASTMLQTWLNPPPADPMQAKLMWIMPLVFSVFFFFFPAGLVLYWLTNNILGIAQQWLIYKQLGIQR